MVRYWGNANSGADVALKKVTASDQMGIRTLVPLSFDDQHEPAARVVCHWGKCDPCETDVALSF
jgi:hypothetical protein